MAQTFPRSRVFIVFLSAFATALWTASTMDDHCVDPRAINVVVNNAGKFYRTTSGSERLIFSRVNLTLPQGTVYGLLGPSGCGKTTLLRCILGRLTLEQGSISVFGHRPGAAASGVPGPNVGYLPQDTCIPDTLTIGECWAYFGTIAGLTKEKIAQAIEYFILLLNLPSANTVNSRLSGGEIRRVAFATALLHEPKLLILDEPTVGIDCITKKNMWDHLLKLAAEKGTSIILTTHYIEEARAAHKVGLMQGGTIAVEDSTENLLQNFGCSSLEEVFCKICQDPSSIAVQMWDDSKSKQDFHDVVIADSEKKSRCGTFEGCFIRVFALKAVIRKNFIHLYRFPGILLLAGFLPCFQVAMSILSYGTSFGQHRMALVNEDLGTLGAQYLSFLDKDLVDLEFFSTPASAWKALRTGDVSGLIDIQQNFSGAYLERILMSPVVKSDVINASTVHVVLDNIYFEISGLLQMHVLTSFGKFLDSLYTSLGFNSRVAQPVIRFDEKTVEFLSQPNSVLPCMGVILMAAFFVAAGIAIINLYTEKHRGNLEQSIIAGLKPCELILGLMITLMAILIVQVAIIIVLSYFMLLHGLSLGGSCLLFVVLYFHGLCGIAFGIMISMCFSDTYKLLCCGAALLIFSGAITGGFMPLAMAPTIYQYVILALPMAYPFRAISAIHFEAVFSLAATISSLACSISWTAVFLTVSLAILKMNY